MRTVPPVGTDSVSAGVTLSYFPSRTPCDCSSAATLGALELTVARCLPVTIVTVPPDDTRSTCGRKAAYQPKEKYSHLHRSRCLFAQKCTDRCRVRWLLGRRALCGQDHYVRDAVSGAALPAYAGDGYVTNPAHTRPAVKTLTASTWLRLRGPRPIKTEVLSVPAPASAHRAPAVANEYPQAEPTVGKKSAIAPQTNWGRSLIVRENAVGGGSRLAKGEPAMKIRAVAACWTGDQ